jgi:squalene synthase HpnC
LSASLDLPAADAYCRFLAGRHYENFSVASRILPARIRLHLARVYAFARTTDDLGDESRGDALLRLQRWREEAEACFAGRLAPIHPVLIALEASVREIGLPAKPFLDLIDANIQDQRVSTYEDWEALRQYCMLSAAPVGRLVLRIFGVDDARAASLSDDVCIGLQLANFAQDVGVDREKGRTYLLQADLRCGGLPFAVCALCDRAQKLLSSGEELEDIVPGRLRLQLALYRLGGLAIVREVRRLGYRTDQRRPEVSNATKVALIPRALLARGRRPGHVPAHGSA